MTSLRDRKARRIIRQLVALRDRLDRTSNQTHVLQQHRIDAWAEGRALEPPILQSELGEASGVSAVAVLQALRRRDQAAAEQAS